MIHIVLSITLFFVALVGALPSILQSLSSGTTLSGTYVVTPIGVARGTALIDGISRFAVKYAYAQRWQVAVVADAWVLP